MWLSLKTDLKIGSKNKILMDGFSGTVDFIWVEELMMIKDKLIGG